MCALHVNHYCGYIVRNPYPSCTCGENLTTTICQFGFNAERPHVGLRAFSVCQLKKSKRMWLQFWQSQKWKAENIVSCSHVVIIGSCIVHYSAYSPVAGCKSCACDEIKFSPLTLKVKSSQRVWWLKRPTNAKTQIKNWCCFRTCAHRNSMYYWCVLISTKVKSVFGAKNSWASNLLFN